MKNERVEIGAATLYLGDCREVLPRLDPGAHAIVSDPPYGINYNRTGSKGRSGYRFKNAGGPALARGCEPIVGDDKPFDPAPLLGFAEVLIWGADHYRARLPDGGRFLAWDKLGGHASWDAFADVEFAWHSHKSASRICSWRWKGCFLREAEDRGKPNPHPTTKPEGLMRWCINQLKTDPSAIVDPYMGSGTTGVACAQLGRRFIGIEIEPRYFEIACRRIEAAQAEIKAAA